VRSEQKILEVLVVWCGLCVASAKVSLSAKAGKPTLERPKSSAVQLFLAASLSDGCSNFCVESINDVDCVVRLFAV
jgi:hypothetical protein